MNKNQSLLQKMILISPELFKKWKQLQVEDEQLSETDRKLKNIISNKKMNETEKWYHYKQVLLQNPHKFRYWHNENTQKSTGTNTQKSIGTQSNFTKFNREIRMLKNQKPTVAIQSEEDMNVFEPNQGIAKHEDNLKVDNMDIEKEYINFPKNITDTSPNKLYQYVEKIYGDDNKLEDEKPSDVMVSTSKGPNRLEKKASEIITESILRRKALLQATPGARLKLKKLNKSEPYKKILGARYHDENSGEQISVHLSTDDEIDIDEETEKKNRRVRVKQDGKGIISRNRNNKREIFNFRKQIPWILYSEKV